MSTPHTELVSQTAEPAERIAPSRRDTLIPWLENAIFAATVVLVLAIPHPTITVLYAFRAIWLLWAVRLLLGKNHLRLRPLYLPIFVFVVLAFIATVHSYEPLMSWNRVERYMELLLVIPIAENLRSIRRVKWLIALLLASSMISVMRTGYEYVHGIGTTLVAVPPRSALGSYGVQSEDMVQEINGHPTRTLAQWRKALQATRNDAQLHLRMARALPYYDRVDRVVPRAALDAWLAWPDAKVMLGRPVRAQGHFYHYVPYAGLVMELGMIAFGLLLTTSRWRLRVLLAVVFLGLLACLVATVSRAHLGALLFACLVVFCIRVRGWARLGAIALFVVSLLLGSMWLRKERGVSWYSPGDISIEYRLLMWRDSLRLMREHPLIGIGPDSELGDSVRWNLEAYKRYPLIGHFHSSPIEIAVTCGLPALAAFTWVIFDYVVLLVRLLKRFSGPGRQARLSPPASVSSGSDATSAAWFPRGLVLGFLGGAIALIVTSPVHYIVGDTEVMIVVWLTMGMTVALDVISAQPAMVLPSAPPKFGA